MKGVNEWRNIQDIIKTTFKALTDVVKAHGQAIKELEKQMPTRVQKVYQNLIDDRQAKLN